MEIKKSRGRPRAFDREQALDQALQLFWAKGYEGTSLADLTTALGINAPSLYAAFESKPALYQAALNRYLAEQFKQLATMLAKASSAREGIADILHSVAAQFTQPDRPPGCPVASGVLRCAEANDEISQFTAEQRRTVRAMIQQRLQNDCAAGLLPVTLDTDALAGFYASVIQGMSVQAIDGASKAELLNIAEIALQAWPHTQSGAEH
jgi:AcrR family transcriptional regulator